MLPVAWVPEQVLRGRGFFVADALVEVSSAAPTCWWNEELEELGEAHIQQKDRVLQEIRQEER
jgi:hypothetical protein